MAARASAEGWLATTPISKAEGLRGPIRRIIPWLGDNSVINIDPREAQADRFADEIIEIADDATNDWMERRQGEETVRVVNHEHIQRSRLRVDARKWLMAKLAPKKYGDSVALTGGGGGPLVIKWEQ